MTSEYFISLIPEKVLYEKISKAKEIIFNEFGNQIYLLDPPHLTLIVSNTDKINELVAELRIKAKNKKKIPCSIIDWLIFSEDKITGQAALALKVLDKDERLLKIQSEMSSLAAIYKSEVVPKRYNNIGNLSSEEKKNIALYGYPYVGRKWLPHISISALDLKNVSLALEKLYINDFTTETYFDKLVISKLKNEKPSKIATINLQ